MRELSFSEERIFNKGERLIPGVTHSEEEYIRHKSIYEFFKKIILSDTKELSSSVRILDLGCGVGYGSKILSEIPHSFIVGIDTSQESIEYAVGNYQEKNISYQVVDEGFTFEKLSRYDYIVSNQVLEHIPNGLKEILLTKWEKRLLISVPYNEAEGNPHHLLLGICEKDFVDFPRAELFYEDMDGVMHEIREVYFRTNTITCVSSVEGLPNVKGLNINFPVLQQKLKQEDNIYEKETM